MSRVSLALLVQALLCLASGCATCCSPFDDTYSGYGGAWERVQDQGRVGSAFAPAGQRISGPVEAGPAQPPADDEEPRELETVSFDESIEPLEFAWDGAAFELPGGDPEGGDPEDGDFEGGPLQELEPDQFGPEGDLAPLPPGL